MPVVVAVVIITVVVIAVVVTAAVLRGRRPRDDTPYDTALDLNLPPLRLELPPSSVRVNPPPCDERSEMEREKVMFTRVRNDIGSRRG